MSILNLFKRTARNQQQKEELESVKRRISRSQETVYKAVVELDKPVNGLAVATHLGWDSASVTNRLAELTRKGRLKIAYNKRGLDGKWRHFYIVSR